MDLDLLVTLALVAASAFFLLLSVALVYPWVAQQFWLGREIALERRDERAKRACEAEERETEARLAAMGRQFLEDLSGPPYRTVKSVFGQLSAVRTGLARYGDVCFRVLHATASAYTGFPSVYQMADQDEYRKRAQLQVIATAATGLELLGRADQKVIFDPSLVTWRVNLERVRFEICPNCPGRERTGALPGRLPGDAHGRRRQA